MEKVNCVKVHKIRFTVEEKDLDSGFSIGHYIVPVNELPKFINNLTSTETVVTSELVYE